MAQSTVETAEELRAKALEERVHTSGARREQLNRSIAWLDMLIADRLVSA